MIKQILSVAIPLAAPTFLYLYFKSRGGTPVALAAKDAPWIWLAGGGVALAAAILGAWALLGGGEPNTAYKPARVIDGRVVPGEMIERDSGAPSSQQPKTEGQ